MLIDDIDFLVNHCLARMEEQGEDALDLVCAEFPDMADELRAEIERRRAKPAMRRSDDVTQVSMAIPESPPWKPAAPGQQERAASDAADTARGEDDDPPEPTPLQIDRPLTHEPKRIGSPRAAELVRKKRQRRIAVAASLVVVIALAGAGAVVWFGENPAHRSGTPGGSESGGRRQPITDPTLPPGRQPAGHRQFFSTQIGGFLPPDSFTVGPEVPRRGPAGAEMEVVIEFEEAGVETAMSPRDLIRLLGQCEGGDLAWRVRRVKIRADSGTRPTRRRPAPWRLEELVLARLEAAPLPDRVKQPKDATQLPSGYAVVTWFEAAFRRAAPARASAVLSTVELSIRPADGPGHLTFGVAIAGADHRQRQIDLMEALQDQLDGRDCPFRGLGSGGGPKVYGGTGAVHYVRLALRETGLITDPEEFSRRRARADMSLLHKVARSFVYAQGRVPTLGELLGPRAPTELLRGKELPRDPWGKPYQIRRDSSMTFTILSSGPDRRAGTSDDIRFPD